MKLPKVTFQGFLQKFPQVELPVRLNKDTHHIFSKKNKPLTESEVKAFILPQENGEYDEFTEYVPCFSLEKEYEYYTIVYWRARLLIYEYFIMTFNKHGNCIAREKIAGMVVHGEDISQAVAMIEEDWIIYVVEGAVASSDENKYNPQATSAYSFQILTDGRIILSENDDLYTE